MANKVKPTNVLVLHGWMMTELGLSGNDLLVYALIYGFTQIDEQWFYGSVEYMSQWANVSDRTIQRVLNKLQEQNLIHREFIEGRTTRYKTNLEVVNKVLSNIATPDNLSQSTSIIDEDPRHSVTPTQAILSPQDDNLSPGGVILSPNNNIYNKFNNNNFINNTITNEKGSEETSESQQEPNMKLTQTIDPVEEVVNSYNTICTSFPALQKLTDKRKTAIKRILLQYSLDEVKKAFEMAEDSDFLSGRNKAWSGCGFDWIMNQNNIVKILEGNYANKNAKNKPVEDSSEFWKRQIKGDIKNAPF